MIADRAMKSSTVPAGDTPVVRARRVAGAPKGTA